MFEDSSFFFSSFWIWYLGFWRVLEIVLDFGCCINVWLGRKCQKQKESGKLNLEVRLLGLQLWMMQVLELLDVIFFSSSLLILLGLSLRERERDIFPSKCVLERMKKCKNLVGIEEEGPRRIFRGKRGHVGFFFNSFIRSTVRWTNRRRHLINFDLFPNNRKVD